METLEARRILEFQGPATTFWSPDGGASGFFDGGKLKVVDLTTGQMRIVCDAPDGFGGSWGPDDTILFGAGESGIRRVSARGGPITTLTSPRRAQGEQGHRWPQWLPDGRRFLYLAWIAPGKGHAIHVGSVDSQTPTFVASSQSAPLYHSAGHILFIDGTPSRLVALPFECRDVQGHRRGDHRSGGRGQSVDYRAAFLCYLTRRLDVLPELRSPVQPVDVVSP